MALLFTNMEAKLKYEINKTCGLVKLKTQNKSMNTKI